jgi:Lrp/AsnC family leucine-responsive transcriptional regulator
MSDYYLQPYELDDTDKKLLHELAANSRAAASSLAQVVGLTRQAVSDRMERLRVLGVIQRYTISVDAERLGLSVRAFVAVTLLPACSDQAELDVIELLKRNPWVQECYRVTGDDYFQVRVVAPDIDALKELVLDLRGTGVVQGTRTMLSLETLFEKTPYEIVAALGRTWETGAPVIATTIPDQEDVLS